MDVDLIKVVNKLQDTFAAIGGETVDLPQCVVVGAQSSGKSSVLETIVGKDFLPRGSGIVTRRPLVLQLVHTPSSHAMCSSNGKDQTAPQSRDSSSSSSLSSPFPSPSSTHAHNSSNSATASGLPPGTEYGEFLHLDKRFTDFAEIRKEIENETFRVAGQNKGVSKLPIHLKIYSPNVLNLTLVDLPGLTKIPVGDQPSDIERQIYGLVSSYISKPNCIIIAVSPANVDLANSDSLKLARTIDPQGRRTIGVLTKLDLMDQGTHALDVLTGRVYPLKLGFIGVVNRSQKDINGNVSMLAARRAEEEFFRAHPAYRNISHRSGTKYLTKILNSVLMNHIRDKLPDMKARLNTLMGQTQQELAAFGDTTFLGDQHRGTLILKLMTQFARDFVASIDGTTFDISTKELCGGARVYHIFHDVFGHALDSINPTQNLTVQDIRTAIRNSTGPRPSLFVPEAAFELLIKPQIKLLEPPSLRCVELVYEELMKICHNCTSKELERFPRLHSQLIEVVSELLRERLGPTSEYVQSLIHIQAAYINTNHPAFVQDSANIARQTRQDNQSTQRNLITQRRGSFGSDSQSAGAAAIVTDEDDDQADSSTRKVNGTALSKMGRSKGGPRSHHSGNNNSSSSSSASNTLHSGRGVQQATSSSSCGPASPAIVGSAPRESFLDYFFGGASAVPGSSVSGAVPGLGPTAPAHRNNLLPELSSSSQSHQSHQLYHSQRSNLMAGRTGLEGSSAAYDMKSLDKHLEAGPFTGDHLSLSEREVLETNLIRSLISSYFSIVRQCIQDLVPKAVMHLLVNFSRESVQNRLVSALYKESLFGNLLEEDEALTNERKRLMELLGTYKEAMMLLSGI